MGYEGQTASSGLSSVVGGGGGRSGAVAANPPPTSTHAQSERRDAETAAAQEPRRVTALAVRPFAQGGTAKQVPHPETPKQRPERFAKAGAFWAMLAKREARNPRTLRRYEAEKREKHVQQ